MENTLKNDDIMQREGTVKTVPFNYQDKSCTYIVLTSSDDAAFVSLPLFAKKVFATCGKRA
jgi:hypothetical protein